MTAVRGLLADFERAGGTVIMDGGKVRVRYPETRKQVVAPILARLREHKNEIIRLLAAASTVGGVAMCGDSECAGCYAIEKGRHIHPRKVSKSWLQQWKPERGERKQ